MSLEDLVIVDLGGASQKSGVTGFLALDVEDEMGAGWCGKGVGTWDFQVEPCRQEAGYMQRALGWAGKGIISSCWAPETIY